MNQARRQKRCFAHKARLLADRWRPVGSLPEKQCPDTLRYRGFCPARSQYGGGADPPSSCVALRRTGRRTTGCQVSPMLSDSPPKADPPPFCSIPYCRRRTFNNVVSRFSSYPKSNAPIRFTIGASARQEVNMVVELIGFEPTTSCLQSRRSTN